MNGAIQIIAALALVFLTAAFVQAVEKERCAQKLKLKYDDEYAYACRGGGCPEGSVYVCSYVEGRFNCSPAMVEGEK